ncbi:MAG TPA: hypothetical protein VJI75_00850 [Candidatus Nanoarchaeia archaeon]|nr:hypothetical protein [Candidatus Nanoarchaeia archaeon]
MDRLFRSRKGEEGSGNGVILALIIAILVILAWLIISGKAQAFFGRIFFFFEGVFG